MKRWMTILVILIIIGASAGGIIAANQLYFAEEETDEKVIRAEMGDKVTVHYTGYLQDERIYGDDWRVFDTSYKNAPGDKILTFREGERGEPYTFTLGKGVITGWNQHIKGMKEGDRKTFFVEPENAYGDRSDELLFEVDMTENVPVYEEMNKTEFENTYEQEPSGRITVQDKFWGWNKTVISIEGDMITLRNEPELGEEYRTYLQSASGWTSEVISIDSNANNGMGRITVEHDVDTGIVVKGQHLSRHDPRFGNVSEIKQNVGQNPIPNGIVVEVDDKILIDFNEEVMGRTLKFNIEIISIEKTE